MRNKINIRFSAIILSGMLLSGSIFLGLQTPVFASESMDDNLSEGSLAVDTDDSIYDDITEINDSIFGDINETNDSTSDDSDDTDDSSSDGSDDSDIDNKPEWTKPAFESPFAEPDYSTDGKDVALYFVPHQDDELLCFSGSILSDIRNGKSVRVVLCTYGEKSKIFGELLEKGYELTEEEFGTARDYEFMDSLTAMGVEPSHIYIPEKRLSDSTASASRDQIESIVSYYVNLFPNAVVRAHTLPLKNTSIHSDHAAIGECVVDFADRGLISGLRLFIDSYQYDSYRQNGPQGLIKQRACLTSTEYNAITQAMNAYTVWDPNNGRFAVGYNSVSYRFKSFNDKRFSYYYEYKTNLTRRYGGINRYDTAAICCDAIEKSDTIILASGENFPDALSAVSYGCPILLTGKKSLPESTKEELLRLMPEKIIIMGLSGAISDDVEESIMELCETLPDELRYEPVIVRCGGGDRYDTALEMAEMLQSDGVTSTISTAVVASGRGFADSLSIAPLAAKTHSPILLSDKNRLSVNNKEFLSENENIRKVIIVGSTGVISDAVENEIRELGLDVVRLGGANRYETSTLIASYEIKADIGLNDDVITVASGSKYPDGLVAGVLTAQQGGILLLLNEETSRCQPSLAFLNEHSKMMASDNGKLYVMGSYNVFSDEMVGYLISLIGS